MGMFDFWVHVLYLSGNACQQSEITMVLMQYIFMPGISFIKKKVG